jgi:hypothetical protein
MRQVRVGLLLLALFVALVIVVGMAGNYISQDGYKPSEKVEEKKVIPDITPPFQDQPQIYTDSEYSFSIEVPKDWIIFRNREPDEIQGLTNVLVIRSPEGYDFTSSYQVLTDENPTIGSLSDYARVYKEKLAERWSDKGITFVSENNMTVGSFQSHRIRYTVHFLRSNIECPDLDVIILREERAFIINYGICDQAKFDKYQPEFEKTLSSFKILGVGEFGQPLLDSPILESSKLSLNIIDIYYRHVMVTIPRSNDDTMGTYSFYAYLKNEGFVPITVNTISFDKISQQGISTINFTVSLEIPPGETIVWESPHRRDAYEFIGITVYTDFGSKFSSIYDRPLDHRMFRESQPRSCFIVERVETSFYVWAEDLHPQLRTIIRYNNACGSPVFDMFYELYSFEDQLIYNSTIVGMKGNRGEIRPNEVMESSQHTRINYTADISYAIVKWDMEGVQYIWIEPVIVVQLQAYAEGD